MATTKLTTNTPAKVVKLTNDWNNFKILTPKYITYKNINY